MKYKNVINKWNRKTRKRVFLLKKVVTLIILLILVSEELLMPIHSQASLADDLVTQSETVSQEIQIVCENLLEEIPEEEIPEEEIPEEEIPNASTEITYEESVTQTSPIAFENYTREDVFASHNYTCGADTYDIIVQSGMLRSENDLFLALQEGVYRNGECIIPEKVRNMNLSGNILY